jgi:hypothetical protein
MMLQTKTLMQEFEFELTDVFYSFLTGSDLVHSIRPISVL